MTDKINSDLKRKSAVRKWVKRFTHRVKNSIGSINSVKKNNNAEQTMLPEELFTEREQWKTTALEDFKTWLDEIPSTKDGTKPDVLPDSCDLYTLLSEFTVLRQEIKMQNREQHRTIKTLNSVQAVTDEYKDALHLFKERTKDIATLEINIRLSAEKNSVSHFFDVRDSLIRGHKASLEVVTQKRFFRRSPKGIEKISQGYEMAIRRFDNALARLDIFPIDTSSVLFDPKIMKAVEKKNMPELKKGTVVKEISGGFTRNNEVLRFAQVMVAQ